MKQIRWIAFLAMSAMVAGCHEPSAPRVVGLPDDVVQLASRLPKLRTAAPVFAFPEQGFLLFSAYYGDPHDCPAGCFYDQAWGISYAGRIGWIEGAPPSEPRYDIRSTDQFLFDDALWDRIDDEWIGAGFRIMLGCDADTPVGALERLATRLPDSGWPFLANLLIDVAQRRDARHVVEIISSLGPSTYDYSYSKSRAAEVLASWPSQPTGNYC
jgi:hypothetical protein